MILLEDFELAMQQIAFTDSIQLDTAAYCGEIRKIELESGVYVYNWSITVKEDHCFVYQHRPGVENYHMLLFNFKCPPCCVKIDTRKDAAYEPAKPWFMYLESNQRAEFSYTKGSEINCVVVMFMQDWLTDQMKYCTDNSNAKIVRMKKLSTLAMGALSDGQARIAGNLYRRFYSNDSILMFKSDIYKLILQFMAFEKNNGNCSGGTAGLMDEVHDTILSHLRCSLPCIEELAKDFHISASSLKRHFKARFGKSIYEYYLGQKMELAWKLITEQRLNVGQVASELDYENVSHFSTIFTRHFGCQPGQLKKTA